MNAKEELIKLLMESYDRGIKDTQQVAITAAEQAYSAGVSNEREAIAKMFDGKVWAYDYREIASAIRARGQE